MKNEQFLGHSEEAADLGAYGAFSGPCSGGEVPIVNLPKRRSARDRFDALKNDVKEARGIALVEGRTFMRECIRRSMEAEIASPLLTFSSLTELESELRDSIAIVLLSLPDSSKEECSKALLFLAEFAPNTPVVILATEDSADMARTAISEGAKGYIPLKTNFEIVVEAVRFILAGGTYVPMEYLFLSKIDEASPPAPAQSTKELPNLTDVLTARELGVVRAIQAGKSNKVIAYDLCICEGTVKVHLRNIMKKLKARNRTEVAIRAQTSLSAIPDQGEKPRRLTGSSEVPNVFMGARAI